MEVTTASQIAIVISTACIAINAHQLTMNYSQVRAQIQEFVDAVNKGDADEKSLFWMHNFLYFFLPSVFLYIMHQAKITLWLIIFLAVKSLIGGIFTHWQQSRLVSGEIYLYSHHLYSKVDNLLNIMVFAFVLLGVFGV